MPWLELHGLARGERLDAVARIRFALTGSGGWIIGHQQFSNVSLCVQFEMESGHRAALSAALRHAGLELDPRSEAELDAGPDAGLWRGSLQISFIHDEPDLAVPPPAVPG